MVPSIAMKTGTLRTNIVLDEALVAVVSTDAAAPALDTLAAEVDLLTDALLSHLAYEERELLAPLAAYGFQ